MIKMEQTFIVHEEILFLTISNSIFEKNKKNLQKNELS